MKKYLTSTALMTSLIVAGSISSATSAAAQNRAGALLFGALVGGAIVAGANQNQRNQAANSAAAAQRAQNRNVQTALNYFNFDAGVADGVFGRRTRSAVSDLQAYMNFPISGELSAYEKDFLLSSFARAEAGGATTSNIILTDPEGSRALLTAYLANPIGNGNNLGAVQTANSLGGAANDFGSDASNDFGSGDAQTANVAPQVQTGTLPVFVTASAEPSMDSMCSGIVGNIQTQFCDLRAFAVNEGDRLAATVQGVTRAEISAQCLGFAPTMASYADGAGAKTSFELLDDLHGWAASTGAAASSLEGIAKVCLGVGYASDNSELALASLLALIGLDQQGYSELLGYHLAFGFGFDGAENKDSGAEWLDTASLAFASGEAGLNGQSGDTRAIVASSMASELRGVPTFGVTPEIVPVSADTGGFFSPPASE